MHKVLAVIGRVKSLVKRQNSVSMKIRVKDSEESWISGKDEVILMEVEKNLYNHLTKAYYKLTGKEFDPTQDHLELQMVFGKS